MRKIHSHLDFSILRVNPKYSVHNKIHWPAKAAWTLTLKIKKGAIKKKMDPIKEYISELVNLFKILNEKNNCK